MNARDEIAAHFTSDTLADQLLDAYRAEVLREGSALVEDRACDADFTESPDHCAGLREGAELLNRAAGEKSSREAIATPGFFAASRTYQRGRWLFHCLAIAPNPFNGETRAVGYLFRPTEPATATALDPDDWSHCGWSDITEEGRS